MLEFTQDQIADYIKKNQRRLTIKNLTKQEIKIGILFTSKSGQEANDEILVGANQLGRIPFFTDGICKVSIDDAVQEIVMDKPLHEYELVLAYDEDLKKVENV